MILPEFELSLATVTSPVAVAVSGGSDSLALLLLTQKWAQQRGGRIIALTVDHGLRSASADEIQRLQEWISQRRIEHIILKWEGTKPLSRLQEKAREARYRLLLSWCKLHKIPTLLLGHNQQDQEETFWLRLSAGSGLDGLSGMKKQNLKDGITILRPLLRVKKERLKEILRVENQPWLEDPSNESPQFFRGRFRTFLKEEGLTPSRLLLSLDKLQEDADFIHENLQKSLEDIVQHHRQGYCSLLKHAIDTLHPALRKRLLSSLMQWFSGHSYGPRSKQIQGVIEKIKTGSPFTAGGIYWFHQRGNIYLSRERSAFEKRLFLKDIHEETLWDQRFWITREIQNHFPQEAYLNPLGSGLPPEQRKELARGTDLPRRIWPTLPAIWVKEKVVAVPHLCYSSTDCEENVEKFIYSKPLFTIR